MQFKIRHLMIASAVFAVHFAVRASGITMRSPESEAFAPLAVASLTAVYCGWQRKSLVVSWLYVAVVAMLSSLSFSFEAVLGYAPTGFLRSQPINSFALTLVMAACCTTGALLSVCISALHRIADPAPTPNVIDHDA